MQTQDLAGCCLCHKYGTQRRMGAINKVPRLRAVDAVCSKRTAKPPCHQHFVRTASHGPCPSCKTLSVMPALNAFKKLVSTTKNVSCFSCLHSESNSEGFWKERCSCRIHFSQMSLLAPCILVANRCKYIYIVLYSEIRSYFSCLEDLVLDRLG